MTSGDGYRKEDIERVLGGLSAAGKRPRDGFVPEGGEAMSYGELLQRTYLARREPPSRDRITGDDVARAVAWDEASFEALAADFRAVDRDGDVWEAWARAWLRRMGIEPEPDEEPGPAVK